MYPIIISSRDEDLKADFVQKYILSHKYSKRDIIELYKAEDKKTISIDQIRELKQNIIQAHPHRLVIINDFDSAKVEAQNSILKLLEEGSQHSQFILIVQDESLLLPTILSRCVVYNIDSNESDNAKTQELSINTIFGKSYTDSLNNTVRIPPVNAIQKLDQLIKYIHKTILTKKDQMGKYVKVYRMALQTKKYIQYNNIQPEFALDQIIYAIFSKN